MSDSQRSNPIQQPQRPAQVREFFKQRIAMVTKKVIKAHENPQALLLYDASLQVVAYSHSLAESVYRCNDGSHPVIGRHFCDRGGLRIIFWGKMETALLLKMALSQRDRKTFFCRRSFALGEGFSNILPRVQMRGRETSKLPSHSPWNQKKDYGNKTNSFSGEPTGVCRVFFCTFFQFSQTHDTCWLNFSSPPARKTLALTSQTRCETWSFCIRTSPESGFWFLLNKWQERNNQRQSGSKRHWMKSSCKALIEVAMKLKHHQTHHPRTLASRWSFVPQQFHVPD